MNTSYAHHLPREWHMVTHVFAALGEPTRQKIIMLFEPGEELAIKDIAAQFELGRTTVVHHLTVLHANGILSMRRKGRETLYSVAYDAVLEAIQKMQNFMEQNIWAEIGATARQESSLNGEEILNHPEGSAAAEDLLAEALSETTFNDDNAGFELEIVEETPLLFVHDDAENPDEDAKP